MSSFNRLPFGLRWPWSPSGRTLAEALTLSVLTHALMLSWPMPLYGEPGSAARASRASPTNPLRVSLVLHSAETETESPASPSPSPAAQAQAPTSAKASDAPAATEKARTGTAEDATPLLGYYAASKLTRMPEAIGRFDIQPPAGGDSGLGGKMTVRVWIGANGVVDSAKVLESGLPQAYAEAALAAFRALRFEPGEIGGVPVKSWVEVVIEYADFRDALTPPPGAR